jgi:hypothetical protein
MHELDEVLKDLNDGKFRRTQVTDGKENAKPVTPSKDTKDQY